MVIVMAKKPQGHPFDETVRAEFGKKLKKIRVGKNTAEKGEWTQKMVGQRIGTSAQAVGQYERGEYFPSPTYLILLSLALEAPVDILLPRGLVRRLLREPAAVDSRPASAKHGTSRQKIG